MGRDILKFRVRAQRGIFGLVLAFVPGERKLLAIVGPFELSLSVWSW